MTRDPGWTRILTRRQFLAEIADRPLRGEGLSFTIHSDGTLTGTVGDGRLIGDWIWSGALFCRQAALDGVALGPDCEVIEVSGRRMRYTRDEGRGEASVVDIV